MKEELTQKQKMFCLEYLKDFNATRAYKKVYWVSQKSAEALWCKMLSNIKVSEYLSDKAQKKVEKVEVWVDYVLENLKNIVEIWSWRKTVELEEWKEKKVLDLSNVNSALEKLWKYHKLFTDKVEQSGDLNINVISYKKDSWQN
jgi:phage terminase small subunit